MHAVLRNCHKAPLICFLQSKQRTPLSRILKELHSEEGKKSPVFLKGNHFNSFHRSWQKDVSKQPFLEKLSFFWGGSIFTTRNSDCIWAKKNPLPLLKGCEHDNSNSKRDDIVKASGGQIYIHSQQA